MNYKFHSKWPYHNKYIIKLEWKYYYWAIKLYSNLRWEAVEKDWEECEWWEIDKTHLEKLKQLSLLGQEDITT
jgi:hypothetical protein